MTSDTTRSPPALPIGKNSLKPARSIAIRFSRLQTRSHLAPHYGIGASAARAGHSTALLFSDEPPTIAVA
jgi:hypothetical protein